MRSLFAGAAFGFTVIEADGERLVLTSSALICARSTPMRSTRRRART
jgi:hypothetical protein